MNDWITAEMLGDIATDEQAARMAELLAERSVIEGTDVEDIPQAIWYECLDIISRESYS